MRQNVKTNYSQPVGVMGSIKGAINSKQFLKTFIIYLLLIGLGIIYILPFVWLVTTAVKPKPQVFLFPPKWIPDPIKWENFAETTRVIPFFLYLRNTLIISFSTVVGALISCPLVAYSFARLRWPGRDFLFIITLSTMMIPFPVIMIPLYLTFTRLGWVNTWLPLIVPTYFGFAFYIFLLRQFFRTIPIELSDAARIDGCSEIRIYINIMLPLVKPALAVVAIFRILLSWNDFIGPLIYLSSEDKYTLALGLQQFQDTYHQSDWDLLMAAATLMTLPVIILFFFTQRYFIEGVTLTGMKQ